MNSPSLALTSVQEQIINLDLSNLTTPTETQKHDPSPFELAARVLIELGVPVIPLRPATKVAFHQDWPELASTDPKQIAEWGEQYPEANVASVAKAVPGGVWFFEVDAPNFHKVIEEQTGKKIPKTFTVKSSEMRGHFYFKHNAASIQMGNLQGKIDEKEAWSVRADNRYVVGPGSIHPKTQMPYTILVNAPLVEAPDWLIEWFLKNNSSGERDRVNASPDGPPIPHGSHDNELFRIACLLRNAGMDYEQIKDNLVLICEKRCTGHGSDYVEMCENKARSACKYSVGQASPIPVIGVEPAAAVEIPVIAQGAYPKFPSWVMKGTSIYDGFIEPICAVNTRFPEFMFMPAITLMLNYLALKVTIKSKPKLIPSIWMVSVGKKGRVIKSSCVNDAIEYLNSVGIIGQGNGARNAEGKSLIWTAGSTEGLGMEMARTNCKNAVLFYDELGVMTSKVKIEASSMAKHLMTMYESGQFSNTI
jgi:hypothetical protein